jgi:hypothetical protein
VKRKKKKSPKRPKDKPAAPESPVNAAASAALLAGSIGSVPPHAARSIVADVPSLAESVPEGKVEGDGDMVQGEGEGEVAEEEVEGEDDVQEENTAGSDNEVRMCACACTLMLGREGRGCSVALRDSAPQGNGEAALLRGSVVGS